MDRKFQTMNSQIFDIPASTLSIGRTKAFYIPEKKLKTNIGNTRLKI